MLSAERQKRELFQIDLMMMMRSRSVGWLAGWLGLGWAVARGNVKWTKGSLITGYKSASSYFLV